VTGGAMRALVAWCLFVYGYAAFNGRPLTMHEARLPQTAREMQATGELLLPHSGSRPWLERPPLPHWIVIAFAAVLGHHDRVIRTRFARTPKFAGSFEMSTSSTVESLRSTTDPFVVVYATPLIPSGISCFLPSFVPSESKYAVISLLLSSSFTANVIFAPCAYT